MLQHLIYNLIIGGCISLVKQNEEITKNGNCFEFDYLNHAQINDFLDAAEMFAVYDVVIPPMRGWLHYG